MTSYWNFRLPVFVFNQVAIGVVGQVLIVDFIQTIGVFGVVVGSGLCIGFFVCASLFVAAQSIAHAVVVVAEGVVCSVFTHQAIEVVVAKQLAPSHRGNGRSMWVILPLASYW